MFPSPMIPLGNPNLQLDLRFSEAFLSLSLAWGHPGHEAEQRNATEETTHVDLDQPSKALPSYIMGNPCCHTAVPWV